MQLELKKEYNAKVLAVVGDGHYMKDNKTNYKNLYTLEIDGAQYSLTVASDKTPEAEFKVGDQVTAVVNWKNERGNLGSLRDPNKQKAPYKGGGGSKWTPKKMEDYVKEQMAKGPSMAIAYAQQFHAANGFEDTPQGQQPAPPEAQILNTAEMWLTWMNDKTLELLNNEKLK